MGLYDNYQLANSSRIKEYQGSTVPELVKVNQELQNRYDTAVEGQDYIARFMGSMSALPQDKKALREMTGSYQERLKQLSARPDLENSLRETTMLGRDVPEAYAPFAQRMKDFTERKDQLEKAVQDGTIMPVTAERLMQKDLYQDPGIQKDPETGRYSGRFNGTPFVKDIQMDKKVDEWMEKALPSSQGWSKDFVNGQWIVKKGGKTVKMDAGRIQQIISAGASTDSEYQAWARQQQDLNTFDYQPGDLGKIDFKAQMGSIRTKDAAGKEQTVPITLEDMVKEYTQKGIPIESALKELKKRQIGSDLLNRMYDYGVSKYERNDVESESGLSANQVWKWNHDDEKEAKEKTMFQMATTATLGGAKVENLSDFTAMKDSTQQEHDDQMTAYARWLKGLDDGKQKITSSKTGKVYYKDDTGKLIDVTQDAEGFRQNMKYAKEKQDHLGMIEDAAKRASKFEITPTMKREADAAVSKAGSDEHSMKLREMYPNKDILQSKLNDYTTKVYEDALRKSDPRKYQKYEEELKRRMTGTTMGSDLFLFRDEKTIDNLSQSVGALVSGLKLEKGMVPVTANDGTQLTPDQWAELQGNMRAIGVTYTGDPRSPVTLVVRAFKDVKGKKTAGEDMIVKLPNTNIQSITNEFMDPTQRDYLRRASGLAAAVNNPGRIFTDGDVRVMANTDDPRSGWKVKAGNTEVTLYNFKDILNFIAENKAR